jgi:hypothetical protein
MTENLQRKAETLESGKRKPGGACRAVARRAKAGNQRVRIAHSNRSYSGRPYLA